MKTSKSAGFSIRWWTGSVAKATLEPSGEGVICPMERLLLARVSAPAGSEAALSSSPAFLLSALASEALAVSTLAGGATPAHEPASSLPAVSPVRRRGAARATGSHPSIPPSAPPPARGSAAGSPSSRAQTHPATTRRSERPASPGTAVAPLRRPGESATSGWTCPHPLPSRHRPRPPAPGRRQTQSTCRPGSTAGFPRCRSASAASARPAPSKATGRC